MSWRIHARTLAALTATWLGAAALAAPAAQAQGGRLDGFTTTDFAFLNALQTSSGTLGQLTLSQASAAASTGSLQTKNDLGELVLDEKADGRDAYGHGAGVSVNLGSAPGGVPQVRETVAEATSPPRSAQKTSLVDVPAAPLATASVLPSTAAANPARSTGDPQDFCPTLGGPISTGSAALDDASLVDLGAAVPGAALADTTDVATSSLEALASNGEPDRFGLVSSSTLQTAGLTLFKGIAGAETTIRIVNPVTLQAFASGIAGRSGVGFGDKSDVPVVSISNGKQTATLTLHDLLGDGVTIDLDGLLRVEIGLKPKQAVSADGTTVTASADLVHVQVVGKPSASAANVGGPLGPVVDPVLQPVFAALDQAPLQDIDQALADAGLTTAADIHLGHFEATAHVPAGGVRCELPVRKTADPASVDAGGDFTYTITVDNPFSCPLAAVRLDDTITPDSDGVLWHVTGTRPAADTVGDAHVHWDDIGPIPAGGSRSVTIAVHVPSRSGSGVFTDHAVASGTCHGSADVGTAAIAVEGEVTVRTPQVVGRQMPNTGADPVVGYLAAGLLLAGAGGTAYARRRRA
jgi:LPXTG-motif cell wall-anchored protein/uncharacterized repeat protein (TIGR01451 family)